MGDVARTHPPGGSRPGHIHGPETEADVSLTSPAPMCPASGPVVPFASQARYTRRRIVVSDLPRIDRWDTDPGSSCWRSGWAGSGDVGRDIGSGGRDLETRWEGDTGRHEARQVRPDQKTQGDVMANVWRRAALMLLLVLVLAAGIRANPQNPPPNPVTQLRIGLPGSMFEGVSPELTRIATKQFQSILNPASTG
jgi:hypothetical protein